MVYEVYEVYAHFFKINTNLPWQLHSRSLVIIVRTCKDDLMGFVVEKSPLACTGMPMGSGVCSLWVLAAVGVLVDLRSKKQIKYTAIPVHHLAAGQVRSSLRASQERYEVREGVHLIE